MNPSQEEWNKLFSSKEAQALIRYLQTKGEDILPQVKKAIEENVRSRASALLDPLMREPTAEQLLRALRNAHG